MVKVVLTSFGGRKTELFSDHTPLREALSQLHAEATNAVLCVNGTRLGDEDYDKALHEFSRDAEVRMDLLREREEPQAEMPFSSSDSDSEYVAVPLKEMREAINKARQALDDLLMILSKDEVPF